MSHILIACDVYLIMILILLSTAVALLLLELVLYFLEEERVMQHSSVSISLSF